MFVYVFIKSYMTLIDVFLLNSRAFQVALVVRNPPDNVGVVRDALILGWEHTLETGMATHSSIAWKIPWTEESGRLQSMGWRKVRHS